MDANSEARLTAVHPELASRIRQLDEMLATQQIFIRVTQALRTWGEQDALYAQGRTTPGATVTKAKGGYSWHNFGLAVDVAPFDGSIPDWSLNHPAWARIVAVGQSLGLVDGISWHDEPHLQLTGSFPATPDDEVREIFTDGGIQSVWAAANIHGPESASTVDANTQ
jgi:peptidoglycan L-alanyl-D-glutamate endopeptidase CwlK